MMPTTTAMASSTSRRAGQRAAVASDPDLSAFPLLRLDQLQQIDATTLRRSLALLPGGGSGGSGGGQQTQQTHRLERSKSIAVCMTIDQDPKNLQHALYSFPRQYAARQRQAVERELERRKKQQGVQAAPSSSSRQQQQIWRQIGNPIASSIVAPPPPPPPPTPKPRYRPPPPVSSATPGVVELVIRAAPRRPPRPSNVLPRPSPVTTLKYVDRGI